jgi:hypothetical protein
MAMPPAQPHPYQDWAAAQMRRFNKETKTITIHNRLKTLAGIQNIVENHVDFMRKLADAPVSEKHENTIVAQQFALEYHDLFQKQIKSLLQLANRTEEDGHV